MSTESTTLVIPGIEASKLALITPESATAVRNAYLPHFTTFLELEKQASQIAVNSPKLARLMRLDLRKVRVAADKDRAALGTEAKRYKEAVDQVYNLLEDRLKPIEQRMESIERAEEIAAKERAAALKVKRLAELAPFGQDNSFYALDQLPETQYVQLFLSQKTAYEVKQAELAKAEADRVAAEQARLKREADLAAENKRLADEAAIKQKALDEAKKLADQIAKKAEDERKAADAEKARLKKEADDRLAAQAKKASDEAARIKKAADDKAAADKAKRDADEKAAQAERDRVKAAEDLKAKQALDAANALAEAAKKKADELAAQDKARQDREAADKAKADAAAKQAASASDADKVRDLANKLAGFKCPTLTNKTLQTKIDDQLGKMGGWLRSEAGKL